MKSYSDKRKRRGDQLPASYYCFVIPTKLLIIILSDPSNKREYFQCSAPNALLDKVKA